MTSLSRIPKRVVLGQDEDNDEFVQVIHTNLVKPTNNNCKKFKKTVSSAPSIVIDSSTDTSKEYDVLGLLVSGKCYYFSSQRLYDHEPDNTLMNPHSGEYKKRINPENHTIEYLEPLRDFNLVVDYINGYNPAEFHLVFQVDYPRIEDFKIMVSELGFTNLLKIMEYWFPLVSINGMLVNCSRHYITELEPQTTILAIGNETERNVFTHFRDRELFQDYLLEYIQGKKTRKQTGIKITSLINTEDKNKYILSKIEKDLRYFGFSKLLNEVYCSQF